MKPTKIFLTLILSISAAYAADNLRVQNTVILGETGARNLRIQTEEAEERDFEKTVFAIGRIEEIPANRSVLSLSLIHI